MSDIAIKAEHLSKLYRLGRIGTGTLSHDLKRWWHTTRGKEDPYMKIGEANVRDSKEGGEYVWALNDVSFDVNHGDVLGIIGRNGAGKSTLLKILSRITEPTRGQFKAKGRIASLLEVGTGFHPELTGRENIFLNGAILGMTKKEISSKFDAIVSFSGVERYIDTPVKRYSSGMYVRLAFAVAAHLEPEILIIDEVLAVGDAEFQKKCLGKMKDVAGEGRTVLFVSHNMTAVKSLCNKAILMVNGSIAGTGMPEAVLDQYFALGSETGNAEIVTDEVSLISVKTLNDDSEERDTFYTSSAVNIEIMYKVNMPLTGSRIVVQLRDSTDTVAFTSTSQKTELETKETGIYKTFCSIPKDILNQGQYYIAIRMGIPFKKKIIDDTVVASFTTISTGGSGSTLLAEKWPGVVAPVLNWVTEKIS